MEAFQNKIIIAIVGMPGSGKTEAGKFFKQKGFEVLRFGSVVDEGIKEEGLPWTPENNTYYREKIRKELGMAAIAIKMMPKIEEVLRVQEQVVLDGLYSWEEYIYLKKKIKELILLCIYARPSIRYQRLAERKDRPVGREEAKERDTREIDALHKGGPIAIAHYLVKNETTKEDLLSELERFLALIKNDSL